MTELTTTSPSAAQTASWKWFLALGVVLVLLGLAGAGATTFFELTSLLVFVPLLFASSLIQLLTAFFAVKGKESLLHIGASGIEAIVGFLLMAHPFVVLSNLVVLIAILLMLGGLIRLVRSAVTHTPGRRWTLMAGIAALILSVCVWSRLPVSRLGLVGLFLAIDFILHGISWSAVALAERGLQVQRS